MDTKKITKYKSNRLIRDYSSSFDFFREEFDDYFKNSNITDKTKRNLETIKPRSNKEFLKRLSYINKGPSFLFKKNRTKKINTFGLFLKTNINLNTIFGGGSISMYSENDRLDLDIFYKNIIKVRGFRKFDNYNIFNNRSVKQIRSFENKIYYQKINNRIGQYKNYKNITNGKDFYSDFWGRSDIVKNSRVDLNYFENTLNKLNYSNNNLSENFKLKNVNSVDFEGHEISFINLGGSSKNLDVFLDNYFYETNNNFYSMYKTKKIENITSDIKNKKFSGLINKAYNNNNYFILNNTAENSFYKNNKNFNFNIYKYYFKKKQELWLFIKKKKLLQKNTNFYKKFRKMHDL